MAEVSEYEQLRAAQMLRNHEYLVALGLKKASDPVDPSNGGKRRRQLGPGQERRGKKKGRAESSTEVRRSARLAGLKAEESGLAEEYESESEEEEETRKKRRAERGSEPAGDEERRKTAMASLAELRAAILPVVHHDDYRDEAFRRWGNGCRATDWEAFVKSRLSTPPPPSPLEFLQEFHCADVWRLLVCCVLMSRVSSWQTKWRCISDFFGAYPTPTALLEETDHANVHKAIASLGLFTDRLASLVDLTEHFLRGADLGHGKRDDVFQLSLDRKSPYKIRGVGPFGLDSYQVFCKDNFKIQLSEGGKPVAPFLSWRRSHAT